jgi:hypothetical protein
VKVVAASGETTVAPSEWFISRLSNDDGQVSWLQVLHGDAFLTLEAMVRAPDDTLWLAGAFTKTLTIGGERLIGAFDDGSSAHSYVVRLDPDGKVLAAKQIADASSPRMAIAPNGDVLLSFTAGPNARLWAGEPGAVAIKQRGFGDAVLARFHP